MATFQELKEALKVKKVNDEILQFLVSSLRWILHYCSKYDMPIPEEEKIIDMLDRAMEFEKKLPFSYSPDETLQGDKSGRSNDNLPDPIIDTVNMIQILCSSYSWN